jgi:hypothetical protein
MTWRNLLRVLGPRSGNKNKALVCSLLTVAIRRLKDYVSFSTDKYKEENWNLEVTLQELRTQLGDSQASNQRLEAEHKRLTKLLSASRDAGDQHKNESERLQNLVQEMKAKHETDIAHARKHAAGLARDKSDLQQTVDTLKTEVVRAARRFPRFGSPYTPNGTAGQDFLTPAGGDEVEGDLFTGGASTNRRKVDSSAVYDQELGSDYADSPDASPVRPPFLAANHPSNEIEALQQRLAHAQRQINTLKGTLHREKQLRMEYKNRLEASPGGLPSGMVDEEDGEDDGYEDEDTTMEGKKTGRVRTTTPFKVGGRGASVHGHGRGKGRGGRGGITLIQRLGMAAHSPSSEYNDDSQPHLDESPPPVPPIPIRFSQADEDEEDLFTSSGNMREEELLRDENENESRDRASRSPSPLDPPSNRTSVEGMDPVFANVLRRIPSNGSYTGSPLRRSVLSGSARGRAGRRSRGGVPYKEARPPSLVDSSPDVLSAELLGMDPSAPAKEEDNSLEEIEEYTPKIREVETAEFACQTEVVEEEVHAKADDTPVLEERVTMEMGVQADPEPEREPDPVVVISPPPVVTVDQSMQTEEEPVVIIEKSEIGIQHVHEEPVSVHLDMSIGTDPEPDPEPVPEPVMVQSGTQTFQLEKVDVDTQTALIRPEIRALGVGLSADKNIRRTTITQDDVSRSSLSRESTITIGRSFLAEREDEDEDEGEETETGANSETETELESDTDDYEDARQSIMMTTPSGTESREDFHSVMTMTDNDFSESEDEDDGESIKASKVSLPYRGQSSMAPSVQEGSRPSSYYAVDAPPVVEYEEVGVSANFKLEPERIIVHVPPPPKPEVKEMSIQTDEWKPPPPPIFIPAPSIPPSPSQVSPGLYRVGSTTNQQFQFIPPRTPTRSTTSAQANGSIPVQPASPGPLSTVLRASTSDRRQSIELAMAEDSSSRPRVASTGTMLGVIDKTKPPMMAVPPPPRLPPPPNAMPPPAFIPERKLPLNSTGSHDGPPPRPSSPPPAELIQRATTPTFGAVLSVPGAKGLYNVRQSGSSMPPSQAGLRQPPSTSSFRSAANAAAYAQHSMSPGGALSAFHAKEQEKRQFSSTSLVSERSLASPRSSISSERNPYRSPGMSDPVTPNKLADITPRANGVPTDPAVIHAITQTMIGEFMYKYTRRAIGKGHGDRRHKRFFWVHPYTRTLYWSSADPGSSNVSESSAKSGMS